MKSVALKGTLRPSTGKVSSKELRYEGQVPCVLYGGKETLHFSAFENDFRELVYTPDAHFVDLNLGGKNITALMKDIQFHPVSEKILHVDFLEIDDALPTTMEVPVQLTGNAKGVKMGGRLIQKLRRIKVKGKPSKLPEHVEVDVTNLEMGKSIKVKEIDLGEIKIVTSPGIPVVSVIRPRNVVVAEDEEDEEGEEAPAAEGDAPAEGGEA